MARPAPAAPAADEANDANHRHSRKSPQKTEGQRPRCFDSSAHCASRLFACVGKHEGLPSPRQALGHPPQLHSRAQPCRSVRWATLGWTSRFSALEHHLWGASSERRLTRRARAADAASLNDIDSARALLSLQRDCTGGGSCCSARGNQAGGQLHRLLTVRASAHRSLYMRRRVRSSRARRRERMVPVLTFRCVHVGGQVLRCHQGGDRPRPRSEGYPPRQGA